MAQIIPQATGKYILIVGKSGPAFDQKQQPKQQPKPAEKGKAQ